MICTGTGERLLQATQRPSARRDRVGGIATMLIAVARPLPIARAAGEGPSLTRAPGSGAPQFTPAASALAYVPRSLELEQRGSRGFLELLTNFGFRLAALEPAS